MITFQVGHTPSRTRTAAARSPSLRLAALPTAVLPLHPPPHRPHLPLLTPHRHHPAAVAAVVATAAATTAASQVTCLENAPKVDAAVAAAAAEAEAAAEVAAEGEEVDVGVVEGEAAEGVVLSARTMMSMLTRSTSPR